MFVEYSPVELKMNSKFGHDALHLILKLLVFVRKGEKPWLENGVNEHLVPGHPLFLISSQTFGQKVNGVRREIFPLDFQTLLLNFVDKLEFSLGSPRSFAVQHLIEDHTQRPNIALWTVLNGFEDLDRHVKRGAHSRFHLYFLDLLLTVEVDLQPWDLFGVAEITQLEHVAAAEDVGRLQISIYHLGYRWMMPSLTRAKKPVHIWVRTLTQ